MIQQRGVHRGRALSPNDGEKETQMNRFMEGRRTRHKADYSQMAMTAADAEGFLVKPLPYLAAEFAVLRAMQGDTTRDINNHQSEQSETGIQRGKRLEENER